MEEATPTGTINLQVAMLAVMGDLETTALLIPTGMTTLGIEAEVFWLPTIFMSSIIEARSAAA